MAKTHETDTWDYARVFWLLLDTVVLTLSRKNSAWAFLKRLY